MDIMSNTHIGQACESVDCNGSTPYDIILPIVIAGSVVAGALLLMVALYLYVRVKLRYDGGLCLGGCNHVEEDVWFCSVYYCDAKCCDARFLMHPVDNIFISMHHLHKNPQPHTITQIPTNSQRNAEAAAVEAAAQEAAALGRSTSAASDLEQPRSATKWREYAKLVVHPDHHLAFGVIVKTAAVCRVWLL